MAGSYRDLEIYNDAMSIYGEIHKLTRVLPKTETYELGSQLRRASDSIVSNIVEGYGRRHYKTEFLRFLTCSHASSLETLCHLEKIEMLYPELKVTSSHLYDETRILSKRIYRFIAYVKAHWNEKP
jgi:four helix bundle protein